MNRNRAIFKAATTVIGAMVGFDDLLQSDNELIDDLADEGLDYIGKGAANILSLATASEEFTYYDTQTGKCIFDFVIVVS